LRLTPRYPNKTHAYLPKINRYAKIPYNWIKLSTTEIDINEVKITDMKPLKKKLTKNEMRVKKHAKAIRETLKKAKIKISAKQIANL